MNRVIFFVLIVAGSLVYENTCRAQTVSFCADIKENGEMIKPASTFAVTKKGGAIKMLVNLEHKVNADKIVYKVFKVSKQGDQTPEATIEDEVKPEWLWFYHDLFIRSAGNYMVYVYINGAPEIIASGMVHIIAAKE
jgi:hypothetical protein